ncbi:MAG: nuclease [Rhodospirillaceae bacterium]|nr:nuclease [Rhodospirillaceae bacterium]|tara:strand:+ start:195 stop:653 length:459 start_codon:yes stop_codon:yes gene_type:complete
MQSRVKTCLRKNCITLSLLIGFLSCSAFFQSALGESLVVQGSATVVDGDTIIVKDIRIRLSGLSAPELGEKDGEEAKITLQALLLNKQVRCSLSGRKSYERYIGTCWIGARDIAALLIMEGKARDCPRYSQRRYLALETLKSKRLTLPKYCL